MSREEIFSVICQRVCDIMLDIDKNDITEAVSLRDLGLDSIDRSDVIMDTCDDLNIKIPMIDFADLKNIGEIVSVFEERINNK